MRKNLTLLRAASWLEKHKWVKGRMLAYGSHGEIVGACAIGAIEQVARVPRIETIEAATQRLAQYVRSHGRRRYEFISDWNDVKSRTKKQVIEAMRKAAIS